jgi:hypothetical protein
MRARQEISEESGGLKVASHAKCGCLYDTGGLDLPDEHTKKRWRRRCILARTNTISTQARCSALCILLYHSMGPAFLSVYEKRERREDRERPDVYTDVLVFGL